MNEFITNQLISSEFVTGEFTIVVRLAQLDRAFGYGPKGRGFESSSARNGKPCKVKEKKKHSGRQSAFSNGIAEGLYLYDTREE